jgi:protein-tyrosine-phosphatase
MPSILFLCRENLYRSPTAAACLLKIIKDNYADEDWDVTSAGTQIKPGIVIPHPAIEISKQIGYLGMEDHVTQLVDGEMIRKYNLVVVMDTSHKREVLREYPESSKNLYLLSEIVDYIQYDIPDPVENAISPCTVAYILYNFILRGAEKILCLARTLEMEQVDSAI